MMRYMILFLSLSIIGCEGNNELEVGQKTTMTIDKIYDAGTRVKGEVIEAVFNIENTGDYPLVFGEIKGSCSCTVADKPEAPILPGEKGVITAKVDTEKFRSNSEISKYVTVLANTEPNRVTLKIKGKIK
ncbi:MAG: DUF1573 domain-containing protein [Crocinitomicaceae bacterium]|nr:DUF1573 domain-containing protein [Crocinitomicaceae bacterium]